MLFLTYWELNEAMPVAQRLQIVQKLATSGLFPPKGVNVLRFDTTPDAWGILLLEAETEADAHRAVAIWRVAGDGFLKCSRTAPAQPIQAAVGVEAELLQALGSV